MAKKQSTVASYGEQSIRALKDEETIRSRPASVLDSDGLEGCQHTFTEILANAVDEARGGFGKEICITVYPDFSIQVEDSGRGVPMGYNNIEKEYNWKLVFCTLYAGGKYNNEDDGAYVFSLGTNGLGATATQYTSEFMHVSSYNGSTISTMHFKKGRPVGELSIEELPKNAKKKTGTIIHWKPDSDVFSDIEIPLSFFEGMLYRQSIVNENVKFRLFVADEKGNTSLHKEYYYEHGLVDHMNEICGQQALSQVVTWAMETRGRDNERLPEYNLRADIVFCVVNRGGFSEYYHNSGYLDQGGTPDTAVRTAFPSALSAYISQKGWYNKNESKIGFADIADNLMVIVSSASSRSSYAGQTKRAVNNPFIRIALTEFLKKHLEIYFIEHPNDADMFAKQALDSKRSREAAEKARVDIRKKLASGNDISSRVEKFVGCRSKDSTIRELYIVEGDSAMTSCKLGRNAEFQAIIPVRGKTLNCMKSTYAKIFENKIIVDLLRVIGCGVEITQKVKGDINHFDYDALSWSKIIICTDADEDGFQIRTLLLTLFYRLLPTLIQKGRIFIAESPLFEITTKNDTLFAYNEPEKAKILQDLGDTKYTLQRSKGLGENEPDMMWQTTMNPETRRLIAVTAADAIETERIFDTLLGDAIADRKKFIAENGSRYLAQADV